MIKENHKVGYYLFIFKKLGEDKLINESFIFSTSFESSELSQGKIGEFAIFSSDLLKDYYKAEKFFILTIQKNPKNAYWIGNYAIFLHFYKKDLLLADKFYSKSLRQNTDDGFIKFNYAQLLLLYKKNYSKIEKLFKDAIYLEPTNYRYQCVYAEFLFKIKKNFVLAEKICKEVITKSRKNPAWFSTLAQLMFFKGENQKAKRIIDRAFALDPSEELSLELWFYLYAHYDKNKDIAEKKINFYIEKNIQSNAWGLNKNVAVAILAGHPEPDKLKNYAKQIIKLQITNS